MSIDALGALTPLLSPTPDKKVGQGEEIEREIDRVFAQVLLKEVAKTLKDGPMFGGQAGEIFETVWIESMADEIASAGLGAGAAWSEGRGLDTEWQPAPARSPAAVKASISSSYGWRTDPIDGTTRHHDGIDIAAPAGTPIPVVKDGTVVFAGNRGGYGNVVIVDHGDGLQTRYAHCRDLNVAEGDAVRAGDTIATIGSTGRATGPHLHLEALRDGKSVDPTHLITGFL